MNKIKKNITSTIISVFIAILTYSFGFAQVEEKTKSNMPSSSPESIIFEDFDGYTQNTKNISRQDINKDLSEEDEDRGYHFGVWVNYQQQFGEIKDKLLTVGGPSFGFNLGKYFFVGAGIYSAFGTKNFGGIHEQSFVYGGGIVGFRWNPHHPIVFRTQVMIGAIGFDMYSPTAPISLTERSTSLIVVPEIALDIRLVGYLFVSISASYRYVENAPEEWKIMEGLGALSGNVSLGLSF